MYFWITHFEMSFVVWCNTTIMIFNFWQKEFRIQKPSRHQNARISTQFFHYHIYRLFQLSWCSLPSSAASMYTIRCPNLHWRKNFVCVPLRQLTVISGPNPNPYPPFWQQIIVSRVKTFNLLSVQCIGVTTLMWYLKEGGQEESIPIKFSIFSKFIFYWIQNCTAICIVEYQREQSLTIHIPIWLTHNTIISPRANSPYPKRQQQRGDDCMDKWTQRGWLATSTSIYYQA